MVEPRLVASRRGAIAALGLLAVALGILVVVPFGRLAQVAATTRWDFGPDVGRAAWNTLWTSTVVTALALGVGTAAAFVTERTPAVGGRWLRIAMVVPLFVPPYAAALSWMRAYGPGGLTSLVADVEMPGLVGPLGVVVVTAVHAVPLAYVVVAAGF
ncbi:MAG TPA: hypothetical protein ENK55_09980, partial [Actinobacteria bacterium]|nr:hypothetical protein [Actinomycetota bacterium]